MQFQIITFGNGEILKSVLDAIAMCLNAQTGTLYAPLTRLGMMLGALWAACYSIWGDFLKSWGKLTLLFVFVPPLVFVPSVTVYIHDAASNYRDKADHVPYGLACVAHFVSQIGFQIAKQVDQVFAHVDDPGHGDHLQYHKSGFLMASNLIQQARTFRIVNADAAATLREFVCQCVAYEAMLGYKYTFEDLRHSADIWALVSARPSKVRAFVWREPHPATQAPPPPQIVTCQEGVRRFNLLWAGELDRAKTAFGIKLFGRQGRGMINASQARQDLLKYLPASYGFLSGLSKSADQILKQHMMIHAVVDGIEEKSTALGNAPNFAAQRAYLQQRSTYETLGALASESLMTMKAVLEGIVYASFIFLAPLAALPFGVRVLLSWLQTLVWLQMWAPLYAVLNFMMTMGARSKSIAMLSLSNAEGVAIASSAGLANANADISAMAGYLAMSIPFLAIALVKGVGSFVHLASHLGGVSQGAAGQAAGDAVSGNYSFGNVSQGNHQIANASMLQESRAASYRAGSFQFIDGRTDIASMADGSKIVHVGVSNLPVSVNHMETQSAQFSEMAAQSYQKGFSLSKSSAQSAADAYRSMMDLSRHLAKSESLIDGAGQNISVDQSAGIHAGTQIIQDFAKQHGISSQKAADIFGEAAFGMGFFGARASAGGRASLSAADQELLQKAQKYAKDHNFQEAVRHASQASKSLSHALSDEASKRLAEGVSGSYEKGRQQREEASKSYQEAASYTEQALTMRSDAASVGAAYNQQFVEWLARQRSDNAPGHIGYQGAADMMAHRPEEAQAWAKKFAASRGMLPQAAPSPSPQTIQKSYEAEPRHKRFEASPTSADQVKNQIPPEFSHPMGREGTVASSHASPLAPGKGKGVSAAASSAASQEHAPGYAPGHAQGDGKAEGKEQGGDVFAKNLFLRAEKFRGKTIDALGDAEKMIEASSASLHKEGSVLEKKVEDAQGGSVVQRTLDNFASETGKIFSEASPGEKPATAAPSPPPASSTPSPSPFSSPSRPPLSPLGGKPSEKAESLLKSEEYKKLHGERQQE